MGKQVFLFWPGDGRQAPNDLATASIENARRQLEGALRKLGREPRLIEGFISKPHESIEKLGPINDPMIDVCVHWIYAPHTTEGVVDKRNPLLLASNFSGQWPGLVGLLNTGASLESLDRPFSRIWTDSKADTLEGVHSYRQPAAYFPTPGGTFTGESLPGKVTWARSYIRGGVLWMDIGKGEVVKLPPQVRDEWWSSTTREWPLMTAALGMPRDTLMAHYISNHIAVAYGEIFGEM